MFGNCVHTDLALELRETMPEEDVEGVLVEMEQNPENHLKKTIIRILNQKGEEKLGKPVGNYYTIECDKLNQDDSDIHMPCVIALYQILQELVADSKKILVIGLGNREITPDALGPKAVEHLYITRHLLQEGILKNSLEISAFCPGVMAQTGMEASQVVEALCKKIKPETIICIDALAAKEPARLGTTIQICDTGITPGAGVGNRRAALNKRTLGIPVIAVGIPTVIAISSVIFHTLDEVIGKMPDIQSEKYEQGVRRYLDKPEAEKMFVTPKNIDEIVNRVSYTISEAINRFLS